jgi:hypothetical protein
MSRPDIETRAEATRLLWLSAEKNRKELLGELAAVRTKMYAALDSLPKGQQERAVSMLHAALNVSPAPRHVECYCDCENCTHCKKLPAV